MKRSLLLSALLAVAVITVASRPVAAQRANPGLANIVCQLGVDGSGTYGFGSSEEISVVDLGANGTTHIGTALVTKLVGKSETLPIVYIDNDQNGRVNCGDSIVQ